MRVLYILLLLGVWFGCTKPISDLEEDETSGSTGGGDVGGNVSSSDCDDGVGIIDCVANCWSSSVLEMLGDGVCDEGERGPDFSCADWSDDEGDCTPDGGGSDVAGADDVSGGEDTSGEGGCAVTDGGDTTGGDSDGDASTDGGSASGSETGGDDGGGLEGLGGCEFPDGTCGDELARGECIEFGGTWLSDGCPCYDEYMVEDYPYERDPSDTVYTNDFEPSCRSGAGASDVSFAWSPLFDGEYCFTVIVGTGSDDTGIAPILSIWKDDCGTELDCAVGDPTDSVSMASHVGEYLASETYIVSVEHYRVTDIGDFSLYIDYCPLIAK